MSYQDEIIQYLQIPENLDLALKITEVMPEVKSRLYQSFWECVYERLSAKQATGWMVARPQLSFDNKGHYGINLQPTPFSYGEKALWVFMMTENYRLWIGIQGTFRPSELKGIASTRAHEIIDDLTKVGYRTTRSSVWVWNWVDDRSDRSLNEPATLVEISKGNSFGIEMADILWNFFEKQRAGLELLNVEVNRSSYSKEIENPAAK